MIGRATQGVKLINIKDSDSIAAVAKVMHEEDDNDEVIKEPSSDEVDNSSETESTTNDNKEQ